MSALACRSSSRSQPDFNLLHCPPQIVRLRDVYESDTHIFMVQELCTGGSLGDVLRHSMGPLSEASAARLFRGIIKSVLHCHQVRATGSFERFMHCSA